MKVMKVPTPTLATTRRDWDNLFDRVFRGPMFPEVAPLTNVGQIWEPALDFSETEKEYLVRLEAPGFHKENLDVKFDGNVLTLTGQRELRNDMKDEEFIWHEREEGRFTRSLRLPALIDETKIEASYEHGLLVIRLPKMTPAPKARIAIK
jgi:HSP20 family protein